MRLARCHVQNPCISSVVAARAGFRQAIGTLGATALLALTCACSSADAEPVTWVPSPRQSATHINEDLALSLRARTLLQQVDALAGQRLGISVRHRIAILWGTVTSPSMAKAA